MDGKDIPFNFEQFFHHVAVLTSVACLCGHHRDGAPESLRHFSTTDAYWGWDSDLDKYYIGYTLFQFSCYNPELRTNIPLLLRFTSARHHDSVSFFVAFHELENICQQFSLKTCAWTPQWTATPLTSSSKKGRYELIHRPKRQLRSAKNYP